MSDSNVPTIPTDPNLQGASNAAMGGAASVAGMAPLFQSAYFNQGANTGAFGPGAMGGAAAGGAAMQGVGGQALGNSAAIGSTFPTLQPFATAALNTGFDPQNSLYNLLHQQNTDFTNVDLANRGLGSSPWGAGVANTSDMLFNTNWLATLGQRQAQGASTADALLGTGANLAGSSETLGKAGATDLAQGGALPYMTATGINQDLAGFLPYLTQAQQQAIQDYLGVYGQANANNANAVNAGAAQDKADQAFGLGIGSALGNVFQGSGKYLFM